MESLRYLGYCFHFPYLHFFLSDKDYNKLEEESEKCDSLVSYNVFPKKKSNLKRKGRKCLWSETLMNNLVDKYRQKLLMANTKNAKNSQYMDFIVK